MLFAAQPGSRGYFKKRLGTIKGEENAADVKREVEIILQIIFIIKYKYIKLIMYRNIIRNNISYVIEQLYMYIYIHRYLTLW